jgi:hypothetical protein
MSPLDNLFASGTKTASHPRIKSWSALIQNADQPPVCEIVRQRDGLTFQAAKIYMHFAGPHSEMEAWDEALNSFLLEKGIRAKDTENEELRFSLMLRDSLKRPELRYGDGFYNAVLLNVVADYFGQDERIKAKLDVLGPGNLHREGTSYPDCVEMISGALSDCAKHLAEDLHYDRPVAEQILAGAVDKYLDERFSFTNRRILGLA